MKVSSFQKNPQLEVSLFFDSFLKNTSYNFFFGTKRSILGTYRSVTFILG